MARGGYAARRRPGTVTATASRLRWFSDTWGVAVVCYLSCGIVFTSGLLPFLALCTFLQRCSLTLSHYFSGTDGFV